MQPAKESPSGPLGPIRAERNHVRHTLPHFEPYEAPSGLEDDEVYFQAKIRAGMSPMTGVSLTKAT